MTADEILAQLKPLGRDSYTRVMRNHGVTGPCFGVKIEELKKFQKRIKTDYQLSLELFDTGVYDAQYLAGLIADAARMTKKDLRRWLKTASSLPLCSFTVAGVAAESKHGHDLAIEWIDSPKENVALTGWMTLNAFVSITADDELDFAELKKLLARVQKTIHKAPNRVRYAMNNFVIGVGSFVKPLSDLAMQTALKIGKVEVDMGPTECNVPYAPDYIAKVRQRGTIGKKRKSAIC
jgi:3-methyladenine DNA glycosylase AlkD